MTNDELIARYRIGDEPWQTTKTAIIIRDTRTVIFRQKGRLFKVIRSVKKSAAKWYIIVIQEKIAVYGREAMVSYARIYGTDYLKKEKASNRHRDQLEQGIT